MAKLKLNVKKLAPRVVGLTAGAAAAVLTENKVLTNPAFSMIPANLRPLIPGAIGVFMLGSKNEYISNIGMGMVGMAGFRLVLPYLQSMIGGDATTTPAVGDARSVFQTLNASRGNSLLNVPALNATTRYTDSIVAGADAFAPDYASAAQYASGVMGPSYRDGE